MQTLDKKISITLLGLLLILTIPLTAATAATAATATKVGKWDKSSAKEWWTDYTTPNQWIAEKKTIHDQLSTIYKRLGTQKALDNKHFNGWTSHLLWLSLFPENFQQDDYFSTPEAQQVFRQIALDHTAQELFLLNLSPHDNQLNALKIFCQIYQAYPDEMKEYANLAVAFSIVFDQPFPAGWPHAFVNKDSLPTGDSQPVIRFAFYIKAANQKKLLLDIRKINVQDLKFVVDTPIQLSELIYLQGVKIKFPRQLEELFHVVRYDQPRLKSGNYIWSHGQYLLHTIGKKGGLCVDQAYFTIHTGKALGIPSIMFMGQGNSGAHSWVGAMKSYGTWGFDYAKFRSQDYPVGQSYDPQTWRKLTDSECIYLDKRNQSSDTLAKTYLFWAHLNKNSPTYLQIIHAARNKNPQLLITWEMESAVIAKSSHKDQERFWKRWISTFDKQSDLKFRGEKRLLAFYQKTQDDHQYDKLLSSVVKSNKSKREDIVVKVGAEKVFVLIEENKWEEADKMFHKVLQYLRTKAGGTLYYNLVQPYVRSSLDAGKKDYAKTAMTKAKKIFDAQQGSILDHDMKQLDKLAN